MEHALLLASTIEELIEKVGLSPAPGLSDLITDAGRIHTYRVHNHNTGSEQVTRTTLLYAALVFDRELVEALGAKGLNLETFRSACNTNSPVSDVFLLVSEAHRIYSGSVQPGLQLSGLSGFRPQASDFGFAAMLESAYAMGYTTRNPQPETRSQSKSAQTQNPG